MTEEREETRERQRMWSTWLDELPYAHHLEIEEDRDELAGLIAQVVDKAPSVGEDLVMAAVLTNDERLRRQSWREWLDAAPREDLTSGQHRETLAERLAGAVRTAPARGQWGGWLTIRPRAPIASRSDEQLRADIDALKRSWGRRQVMVLSYLARHDLDLVRDGAARCGESLIAFADLLKSGNTAAPFLPALAERLGQPVDDVRAMLDGDYRAHVERALDPHVECALDENCGGADCPPAIAQRKRAAEKGGAWGSLMIGLDGGGRRHFLDGEAVHCGTSLELQALDYRSDDYGEYSVPLQEAVRVRYEAQLSSEDPRATLHADRGGHEFVAVVEQWMRFRWPKR